VRPSFTGKTTVLCILIFQVFREETCKDSF
jgi:hypothetical protein